MLADVGIADPSKVERVVVLSGKLYFQLSDERKKRALGDRIAFLRVEELSPFPYAQLEEAIKPFANATSFVFAQEEPENAGFWAFAQPRLAQLGKAWRYVGRRAMAAPVRRLVLGLADFFRRTVSRSSRSARPMRSSSRSSRSCELLGAHVHCELSAPPDPALRLCAGFGGEGASKSRFGGCSHRNL